MRRTTIILLSMCILGHVAAQTHKCAVDTKALVKEEVAAGASELRFLAKMAPGFDSKAIEMQGIKIGATAGDIVTLSVPVANLGWLDECKDVLQYSISHRIAEPLCNNTRVDTRTDSVQDGLGTLDGLGYDGTGVYIGITDWGFDYTHPNLCTSQDVKRVVRAWDHFRLAGPAPEGFSYGTELTTPADLAQAKGDTSNLYGYGTHGTHVAGISAGAGRNGHYVGQAPGAELLLCSFGLGEAEWMDAVQWMRNVANNDGRRLVINSSWGMYSFSTLDGTSLLSQAVNNWSDLGTIFCTSAGNNGNVNFHISHTFGQSADDTLRTVADYYTNVSNAIGQCLIMWGEEGHDFTAFFRMKGTSQIWACPAISTAGGDQIIYDTLVCGQSRIAYRAIVEHDNPFDHRPHIQLDVDRDLALQLQLFVTAEGGTVHVWNVANKENHAGNEGTPFFNGGYVGFTAGNAQYGISEPACAEKCITVAAHRADRWNSSHTNYTIGDLAAFSSTGPVIDGRAKPDLSAPGVDVVSSISAWTTDHYNASESSQTLDATYIWSKMSGTSMSSPAVTGIVALMLQANPDISNAMLRDIICRTVRNDSRTGDILASGTPHPRWGWGKADALRAVNEAIRCVSVQTAEQHRLPLSLSPNPATHQVTINTGCGEPQELCIFNMAGQLMLRCTVHTEATLDLGLWQSGVYIVRAGSRTSKLIVR